MQLQLPKEELQGRQRQALLQNVFILRGSRSQATSLPPAPAHITLGSAPQAATGHMKGQFAVRRVDPRPSAVTGDGQLLTCTHRRCPCGGKTWQV